MTRRIEPGNRQKERARQWREEEGLGRKRKRRKRLSSNLVVALSPTSSLLSPTLVVASEAKQPQGLGCDAGLFSGCRLDFFS
jgi:hypothetical protein